VKQLIDNYLRARKSWIGTKTKYSNWNS